MTNGRYFVKSMEEDFVLKMLVGEHKVINQTIENIIETGIIHPNTVSFNEPVRLSTTILGDNYVETYRPEGIIFETEQQPKHIFPFDLIVLTDNDTFEVHYYKMESNLGFFYQRNLISGYEQFKCKSYDELIQKYPTIQSVLDAVNAFRLQHGFQALPEDKARLIHYNEAVFQEPVKIRPVAIFGTNEKSKKMAELFHLPYFDSAKAFYISLK
ncbi:MAG: hypothetical protein NTX91_05735 [candidate division SR1 bacterium]|nr:hypothetical protein [candidate division SR1 bacterium]